MTSSKRKVIILGAGLSGLSAGWVLTRKGYEVEIWEKSNEPGGLAVTRTRDGYEYDLGPHNIHTRHRHILSFFKRTFPKMFPHTLTSTIFKQGRFIRYPLKGAQVITSLPVWRLPLAVTSFLSARVGMFVSERTTDKSFGEWIRRRFGDVLYREYFYEYPKKVWKLHPDEIDSHVAEKRIPVLSLMELIRSVVLGRTPRIDHPEFTSENFYLPHGIGELPEFFRKEFEDRGGVIRYGAVPAAIHAEHRKVTSVRGRLDDEEFSVECDYLLSTIPLDQLIEVMEPVPEGVSVEAGRISYVASVLVYLKLSKKDVFPSHMIYFPEEATPFSRASDFARFSAEMVPEGKSLICMEMPCCAGDSLWNMTDEDVAAAGTTALSERGLITDADVDGFFVERLSHSYPRFEKGFLERVTTCLDFVHGFENAISYGRQGGFAYVNCDTVTHFGFHAADAVVMAETMGYRCGEWFSAHLK